MKKSGIVMIGFTISLTHQLQAADYNYLIAMRNAGFNVVLAEIKEPAKINEQTGPRLRELSKWCQNLDLTLIAQASTASFKQMGVALEDVGQVQSIGLKAVAVQRQLESQTVAKLSKSLPVLVEAGKITAQEIANLHEDNANLNNLIALFPAFPVTETGLSLAWLRQKNAWLKQHGIKSAAFVPSDKEAAPTAEKQRGENSLAAFLTLKKAGFSHLFLAGQKLNSAMLTAFATYLKQKKICLHLVSGNKDLFNSEWRTDPYVRQDVICLSSQNQQQRLLPPLEQAKPAPNAGSLGLLSNESLPGGKEILINKSDSALGSDFTLWAQIAKNDLSLLPLIGPNQALLLLPVK